MPDYFDSRGDYADLVASIFEPPDIDHKEYANIADLFDPTRDAWIDTISVAPMHRGEGYAYSMMMAFIEECSRQGVG